MAKPSKGKKALKAEQKAAKQEKAAQDVQARAQQEVAVQKLEAPQAKKDKAAVKPVKAGTPEKTPPAQPSSLVTRAIDFFKANVTWYTIAIILLMAFMFYLRTVPSHDQVFTNWPWINGGTYVNVAEDDGVYHMRLLDNTLQHFPFRILYDPFTHFPYGNTIHFGPLFELIPAAFLLIVGLGHPGQSLIETVAAYYPAFLGTLVIIPTYYAGKKLFGRPAGLIGAVIIAFSSGSFFWRSVLGSTDHHVAEVLFMASTLACLVYALDAATKSKISFEQIKNKDWGSLKMPLIYAALTGIFFGAYLLTWVGALLFAFALFVYFIVQAVIDHYKGRPLDSLVIVSAIAFLIPVLMVLPYSLANPTFQSVYYSLTQPVLFIGAFVGVCVAYGLSKALREGKAEKWAFPVALVGIGVSGILLIYLLAPGLWGIIQYSMTQLWPSGGTTTIGEAYPTFFDRMGQISFATVWVMFYWTFPAAIVGLIMLAFRVFKTRRPGELMFLVWNLVMVWALYAQNRYTYYYTVNAVLLTAYLASEMFNIIDMDKLKESFAKKVDSFENFQRFVKKNMGSCLAVAFIVLVFGFIAIYPALPMSDVWGENKEGALLYWAKQGTATMSYDWYDAMTWMRNHTPDPQGSPVNASFDYWSGQYYKSPSDKTYNYPSSAYGVMSWWDYGHIIEYIANRIPNANPFQAGITEENGTTGASPYFCSTDEEKSVQMLDKLGSRYVVIDNQMATGKFPAIQKWIGDTEGWDIGELSNISYLYSDGTSLYQSSNTVPIIEDTSKWNNSIMNRLYYGDADGMSHYRLIYESAGPYFINIKAIDNGQFVGVTSNPIVINDLKNATELYEMYSQYAVASDSSATTYGYGARVPVKWVKIYEKVKGATLMGEAPDGTNVTATLTLKTDWDRTFNYTATATAHDGKYSFIVPYPTEQMRGDGYSYGILPQTKYMVTYGNTTKSVDVPETAVMSGATIQVT